MNKTAEEFKSKALESLKKYYDFGDSLGYSNTELSRITSCIKKIDDIPADPPPSSEGEMEEVIWGEPLRNSYNKGFLDSKKEQIMDFIKWFGEQDLKRYAEGWCQPGGSNGFHYSDDDLYKLFCNRENVATLPTREPEAKEDEPKYPIDHFS